MALCRLSGAGSVSDRTFRLAIIALGGAVVILLAALLIGGGHYTMNKNILYDRLTGAVWICYTNGCQRIPETR